MSDLVHVQAVPGGNVPQPTFDQVTEMAEAVYKSGLFACKSKEQALTLMLLCQAENLHPINAMRQFHIIQGRPAMRADAMLARFQKAGGKVEMIPIPGPQPRVDKKKEKKAAKKAPAKKAAKKSGRR